MILLNDFQKLYQICRIELLEALEQVGRSGWWILGEYVHQLEEKLTKILSQNFAIGCASGLDALELALRALEVQPGDKIITTPLSAFATTLAILKVGAIPIYVDVDQKGLLDLNQCEAILKKQPDIKGIIPVHLFGHPLNLKQLQQLKQNYGVWVIEDCAQAILADYNGSKVGSVGDLSVYSLYPTKNLGCMGDGGFVITNQTVYADRVKALRDYGQSEKYVHDYIGLNSRLDELQAAFIYHAFLPKLTEFTARRRKIAAYYLKHINHINIRLPQLSAETNSVWHLFPILTEKRDALATYLGNKNIQTGVHYPKLIITQKALHSYPTGFELATELENANQYAQQELSLPIHPLLSDEEIQQIVEQINQWDVIECTH